jgi:hypothetical protein
VQPVFWLTVTDCPATVSAPLRAIPTFCDAVNATVPLPLPAAPDVTVSHGVAVVAVQAQPDTAVTDTDGPVPPPAGIVAVVGETTYEQPVACDTVTV